VNLSRRASLALVARVVGDALRRYGIRAVLGGGACANVYSSGRYQSADVDFVLSGNITQERLDEAMASVGFKRSGDRFAHPRLSFFVEFPRGPLAIGSDYKIRPIEWRSGRLRLLGLSATDSCRDRLAAFYHWNDRQSLKTAVMIASRNRVNLSLIRRWSMEEGAASRFEEFLEALERARARRRRAGAQGRSRSAGRARSTDPRR